MSPMGPITRISLSLALLTLSLLLTGDLLFGTRSDTEEIKMEARRRIAESLAIQFSSLIAIDDLSTIRVSLQNLVQRDDDILSGALRTRDGKIRAEAGNHAQNWKDIPFDRSTLTHTQVPIFKNNSRWGTVQIRFNDAQGASTWKSIFSPFVLLTSYVFLAGFIAYVFFMRRTLKHLDPSAVIPDRVKTALDALSEGVVLVDDKQQIVMANTASNTKLGLADAPILGTELSSLAWSFPKTDQPTDSKFPWERAIFDSQSYTGTRLHLDREDGKRTLMVNSSPILDDNGKAQGALATFDDVTEMEDKNRQLSVMVRKLKSSRDEINLVNKQLKVLAERDPLTNSLNRRSFFELAETEFKISSEEATELTVIMLDIDHFKPVNDEYGHGVGDQVIKGLAETLQKTLRDNQALGRYGGEEFCVLLPGVDIALASDIADRMRQDIASTVAKSIPELRTQITASFGVASMEGRASSVGDLVDQADQALYASKERGRNRVTRWDLI
jgi:diguanylate cyclase (GGDEF)-like protein/PAS domain S-box-containing protein